MTLHKSVLSTIFLSALVTLALGACEQKPGDLGELTDGDEALCGDGVVDPGEQCDDGNVIYMIEISPYGSNSRFHVS
ncbi:hypothetical protein [Nannocystis pusilla]|uniref:Lipoprotein n=1 Tax=Nannocystis pusilla TaxID=889268 RepID=A0ABS7U3Q5_9BACT|nr:hypothetical protein [Nannocystis pusilla]MBZ5714901.1 hypothetical protein [Nannocystis pusilla]